MRVSFVLLVLFGLITVGYAGEVKQPAAAQPKSSVTPPVKPPLNSKLKTSPEAQVKPQPKQNGSKASAPKSSNTPDMLKDKKAEPNESKGKTVKKDSPKDNKTNKDGEAKNDKAKPAKSKVEWLKTRANAMPQEQAVELCDAEVAKIHGFSFTPYSHPAAVIGGAVVSLAITAARVNAKRNKCMASHGWKRKPGPPRPASAESKKE